MKTFETAPEETHSEPTPLKDTEPEQKKEGDLQDPDGYVPYYPLPHYTVQQIKEAHTPHGRTYKFRTEEEARRYIQTQIETGFSGVVSLRKNTGCGGSCVSDLVEKIGYQSENPQKEPPKNHIDPFVKEIVALATAEWHGVKELLPYFPAFSESPQQLADIISERRPDIEVRVSMEQDKYPFEIRLRPRE